MSLNTGETVPQPKLRDYNDIWNYLTKTTNGHITEAHWGPGLSWFEISEEQGSLGALGEGLWIPHREDNILAQMFMPVIGREYTYDKQPFKEKPSVLKQLLKSQHITLIGKDLSENDAQAILKMNMLPGIMEIEQTSPIHNRKILIVSRDFHNDLNNIFEVTPGGESFSVPGETVEGVQNGVKAEVNSKIVK